MVQECDARKDDRFPAAGPHFLKSRFANKYKDQLYYNYDLISGKVNQVSYQPHLADAFYLQYSYDAENRITNVRTSTDSIEWQNDASYTYYRHGPLARVQFGDLQLQGVDYAYTVQGWLKSINPSWITPTGSTDQFDTDGVSTPALFERDAYKLNLNYFDDGTYTDFSPVHPLTGYVQGNGLLSASKHNLYNGNIGSMAINIRQLAASSSRVDAGPMLYNYQYDQLNRISSMDAWAANGSLQPVNTSPLQDYAERYSYDPNGNILTLNRNGDSTGVAMDQLSYQYLYANTSGGTGEYVPGQAPASGVAHLTNQLSSIRDAVTGNSYTGDIKSQSAFNYTYDAIGELTGDAQQEITNVTWNVYGKILSLSDSGNTISFTYDAAGNRISKTAHGITTWYVRDAQGNVMSVYTQGNSAVNSGAVTQTEADLYGSSRLGLLDLSVNCGTSLTQPLSLSLVRGNKLFELTNHLGNVLETISDKKVQHTSDNSTVDYYLADVLNANDYYSFGMQMPVRSYNASTAANYRYGFNGKEQDNEVKGTGNQIDYGMRGYDPRAVRFWSVDPIAKKYPELTPYQFASDNPIMNIDIDGLESFWYYFSHGDPVGAINYLTLDDLNEGAGYINNSIPVSAAINGGFQAVTGRDPISLQPGASRIDGLGNAVIGSIFHFSAPYAAGAASTGAKLERQMAENTAAAVNKPATTAHGDNTGTADDNSNNTASTNNRTTSNSVSAQTQSVRPTPQQSEQDLTPTDPGELHQQAFKNGNMVASNTQGSVRPESYNFLFGASTEVKNFTFKPNGVSELSMKTLVKQIIRRQSNLPSGTTQNVIIDLRGQNVGTMQRLQFRSNVLTQLGNAASNVTIDFETEKQ